MPAQASAKDFFMTLSRAIGHDCRPYFKTQGIEAFGLGGETCEIAGDGKLVFSDREMEKMKGLSGEKAVQKAFNRLFPGWKVSSCSGVSDEGWNRIGYLPEISERRNICCTLPKSSREPARFVRNVKVPENGAVLCFSARKTIYANAGFMVEIAVGGKVMREVRVEDDDWVDEEFDLAPWSGKTVKVEVRHREIPGLKNARAAWSRLEIR